MLHGIVRRAFSLRNKGWRRLWGDYGSDSGGNSCGGVYMLAAAALVVAAAAKACRAATQAFRALIFVAPIKKLT